MSWDWLPVSSVCEFAVDCVNKTAPISETETPFKMIRTTNVKGGFINLNDVKYVSEEIFEKWTRRSKPRFGDVILTREAPVGEVGRFTSTDENVFLGQRLFHYRPDPKRLDWNYLAYALQSREVQGRLKGMGFGATVEHIKVGDAERLKIPVPPIGIQLLIGGILSNYDDLIENNSRRIKLLEESARLLYREWFVYLRFPGHEHVKVVDGVPDGWERASAFDVMDVLSGGTPKTDVADYWDGEIPFFTPKDAVDSPYVLDTEKTLSDLGLSKCNSRLYPKDTLFITARGTVGNLNLAQVPMAMNQSCYALVAKPPLTQFFLYCALGAAIDQFKARAVGAVFDAIVVNTFKQIPFIKPSEGLIREFNETVEPIFWQIDRLILQSKKLREARDLLLPRLMSGELEV